jgi:putative membrane protein
MYSLRFNQAMSAINSNKNIEIEGLKNQNLKIFEQFVFGYPIVNRVENQAKPDPYFKTQLFIKTVYLLVLINVIAISLLGVEFSVVNLLLVPWFLFLNYLRYKKSYYNYQKDYIILGEGRVDTVTNIFEHHKIQSLKIKQSFFQKKREVASITVYTASNFMTIPSMPYAEAIILYDNLLYKVESTDLDWI